METWIILKKLDSPCRRCKGTGWCRPWWLLGLVRVLRCPDCMATGHKLVPVDFHQPATPTG